MILIRLTLHVNSCKNLGMVDKGVLDVISSLALGYYEKPVVNRVCLHRVSVAISFQVREQSCFAYFGM